METRSRKRAEASSAAAHPSSPRRRPSKRPRSAAAAAASTPTVTTRSRSRDQAPPLPSPAAAAAPMDSSEPSSTRRRSSGKNQKPALDRDPEPPAPKGKERDTPEASSRSRNRDRDRDAERLLRLSFDSGGVGAADDDDDGEGAVGILHQNLTSASSALQGLLRKLGAGLDDLLPSSAISGSSSSSHMSGRLKKMLAGLRADGEEGKQVESLTQLCEMLSIGTEESLGSFSVDSFVPVLVGMLNHESNPDIMLLAARALTHLCDVLPSSCAAVVHYGAVPCFCARLLTIEYMDLAEQSLQALKKISQEHPAACLRAGALMAVLSYLDFFSTGVQRVALATAANICKKLPSDAADFVMEAVPLLTNLLHFHDSKVLEHACVCLTRITESFASSPENLDELCNRGLVAQAASLVSISTTGGQASLSTSTYTGLLHLLSTCASGSSLAAKTLLLLGISGILKDILSGSGIVTGMPVSSTITRPFEQIYEIVNLANELLPPLPHGTISLPVYTNILIKGSAVKRSSSSTSYNPEEANEAVNEIPREKLLHDQPELLKQFGIDLLPVLLQVYGSSVSGPVRHKCLLVIGKLMHFSTADMIQDLLGMSNLSSFLAGALAWKDPQVLIPALQIAGILMEKLPSTFCKMFIREGVVHAVDALICLDSSGAVPPQAYLSETDNVSFASTSSRPRRSRRRSGSLNTENNSLGDSKGSGMGAVGVPPSVEVPSANSSARAAVGVCAKAFKDKYFPSNPGADGVTDDLRYLKGLCSKLNGNVETKSKGKSKAGARLFEIIPENEERLIVVIAEMLSELNRSNGVSTFEFIGSGAVLALLNYLSCGTFGKERISESNLPKLREHALKRYKLFISQVLPASVKEGNEVPLAILVKKLQDSLSSLERFPVVLSHTTRSSSGSTRLSSGLSVLSQPLKLRLCRSQGEKSLRDYSSNVVLIDPLASLAAVEEFLWPRIQKSGSGQKTPSAGNSDTGTVANVGDASLPSVSTPLGRRPSTRLQSSMTIGSAEGKDFQDGNATISKGKGKAVIKSNPDEVAGSQTRMASRHREGSDKEGKTKHAHLETNLEDEELDVSPAEFDEALVIEDEYMSEDEDDDHEELLRDESLPPCNPESVHDVKLGDSMDDANLASPSSDTLPQASPGSSSRSSAINGADNEFASSSGFSSRGAMSFAAAAMAGLASVSGRGVRSGRDRHGLPPSFNISDHYNKLIFTVGGKQLNKQLTIYQAIQRWFVLDEDGDDMCNGSDLMPSDSNRLWSDIYTITYQRADTLTEKASGGSNSRAPKSAKSGSVVSANTRWQQVLLPDSILQGELPCELERSNPTYNILALLRVLDGLNQLAPLLRVQAGCADLVEGNISNWDELFMPGTRVSPEEFVNSKLTPKLSRQIQDPLALCSGSLPPWCYQMTRACPFLFPFETRRQYFYSTAFGLSRALHWLQQQHGADNNSTSEREVRVGRLQRQKVRVSRSRILDSAMKVMEMYSSQKAVLEVEYFGEVGTGLGPTLEFYTLLSHDLQKVGLEMWRSNTFSDNLAMRIDSDDVKAEKSEELILETKKPQNVWPLGCDNHVHAPLGLFPRPWPSNVVASDGNQFCKVLEYFRLVGRVMAKSLQDGRLLDLPLSTAFYKLVLGHALDLHDILSFDSEFGKTLQELQVLVRQKQFVESSGANQKAVTDLCFHGAPVEDLFLDFTLPGYPDYILKEGEGSTMVNIENLEEYICLVVDATVNTGIMRQIEAFREGFNQVFDISSLQIFSSNELDYLLCGRRELWEPETLGEHIKFDHGYTAKSPAIAHLLEIMGEFTQDQQHAFCQFVTGAPRLPPGGLAALNPKLTIVRKHSSASNPVAAAATTTAAANDAGVDMVDDDLPSVMTCANYLKLPAYSTKEIMRRKLLYAIYEGRGSFDLS